MILICNILIEIKWFIRDNNSFFNGGEWIAVRGGGGYVPVWKAGLQSRSRCTGGVGLFGREESESGVWFSNLLEFLVWKQYKEFGSRSRWSRTFLLERSLSRESDFEICWSRSWSRTFWLFPSDSAALLESMSLIEIIRKVW